MGINLDEIRELVKLVEEADISSFSLEHEGLSVTIEKEKEQVVVANQAAPQVVAPAVTQAPVPPAQEQAPAQSQQAESEATDDANLHQIVSPMVGTFYRAPSPESDPYVKEGDQVSVDTKVCIIEAMKLMNEIEAEVNGTIEKILVENGELVEYGQPLFLVKTT